MLGHAFTHCAVSNATYTKHSRADWRYANARADVYEYMSASLGRSTSLLECHAEARQECNYGFHAHAHAHGHGHAVDAGGSSAQRRRAVHDQAANLSISASSGNKHAVCVSMYVSVHECLYACVYVHTHTIRK
jgi:hypothetical protein